MRIFFTEHPISLENLKPFQETTHVIKYPKEEIPNVHEFDRSALLATLKVEQPEVLVVGLKFKIDKEVLDSAPIKAVFTRTTNITDHIDLKYCEEKGIEIIPLVGSELTDVVAVPELSLWAMLELVRRRGGQELKGKTLGIIGRGRIGTILGDMVNLGFEMKIATYDIIESRGMNELETVLKQDIVSLNISSTEENRNFMDRVKFEMMKDGSYFLNSSRGWLVDESALKWALESGKLAGAWSDFVLDWTAENLIQTNHIGGKTQESSLKTEVIVINKLIRWLKL